MARVEEEGCGVMVVVVDMVGAVVCEVRIKANKWSFVLEVRKV